MSLRPDTVLRRAATSSRSAAEPARLLRVLAVVGVAIAVAAVAAAGPVAAQESNDTEAYAVVQGEACYDVEPLGDGDREVRSFYDYRTHGGNYSSQGTTDLQLSDTSQLFLYEGSEGVSLVVLHDRVGDGRRTGGGVVTGEFSGLPVDGQWVVQDDNYGGEDDVWNVGGSDAHVEWVWVGGRTDGAVFRGLDSQNWEEITVDLRFNEAAEQYPYEGWDSQPQQNRVGALALRSAGGSVEELSMSQSLTVVRGTCAMLQEPETTTTDGTTETTRSTTQSADEASTPASGPGFTVVATLLAVVGSLLVLARRRD